MSDPRFRHIRNRSLGKAAGIRRAAHHACSGCGVALEYGARCGDCAGQAIESASESAEDEDAESAEVDEGAMERRLRE
jgi:hypothetical protein